MTEVAVRQQIDQHVIPYDDLLEHLATLHCPCKPEQYKFKSGWVYIHNPYTDKEAKYFVEDGECQ